MLRTLLLCSGLGLSVPGHPEVGPYLSAQEARRASGEVLCEGCRITFDTLVSLGGVDVPGADVITDGATVAVDAFGRILVAGGRVPEIAVFDSTGVLVKRVGRRGQGPGEFTRISQIDVGDQYVHVFDYNNGRILLDKQLNVIRTDRVGGQIIHTAIVAGDAVLFSTDVHTSESAGHPIHRLDPDGSVRSSGGEEVVYRRRMGQRVVAASEGRVWTIDPPSNLVEAWQYGPTRAKREASIQREVSWFDRDKAVDTFMWPRSYVRDALLTDDGLWVVSHTPDQNWTHRMRDSGPIPDEPSQTILDGWLELLNPKTLRTVTRVRSDYVLLGFAKGSELLVAYSESEIGVPIIHILRVRLEESPPAR